MPSPKGPSRQWQHWEHLLRTRLENPGLLMQLREHRELYGFEDPHGRLTFSKVVTKADFGALSHIVTGLIPMAGMSQVPSLARILRRDPAVSVLPSYFVVFASNESEPGYTPTPSSHRMDMDRLLDRVEPGRPLIGLAILENPALGMAHGIAFLAWRDAAGRPHFAYYDPLAYSRKRTRADGTVYYADYDYARKLFQEARYGPGITFHNLSDHCIRVAREGSIGQTAEYHCPQYVMNAEYCYLFSLYFLTTWMRLGYRTDPEGLQEAVRGSYVVDPERLTRANTREGLTFRVILMSFILTSLSTYLRSLAPTHVEMLGGVERLAAWHQEVVCFSAHLEKRYGLTLLRRSAGARLACKGSSSRVKGTAQQGA